MKNITYLLEETLLNLKNKNIIITPNSFEKEFYTLLSKSDIVLEDHKDFEYLVESLNDDERLDFQKHEKTSLNLAKILMNRVSNQELKLFLKHLIYFISPSIANCNNNELQEIIYNIAKKPHILVEENTIRNLRRFTDERVVLDNQLFDQKASDIKKIIDFFEEHIKNIILEHDTTREEILYIKDELEYLDLSNTSKDELKHFQEEMMKIVSKIEQTIEKNNEALKQTQDKNSSLYEQIEILQDSLNKAEKENSVDFLTGVLTRRAYAKELERVEEEYKIFDANYAIVFYDIDHFKQINDKFGHKCGDVVLRKFAKILDNLTRTGDIISRYGGEEFIALIHYNEPDEVIRYIKRVKNIIFNNKFIYKENKIDVRFSAGIVFRGNYNTYEEAVLKVDELLYQAKADGRNRIVLDSEEII